MSMLPGGAIVKRILHLFFCVDISLSMGELGKIQAANFAMREMIPETRRTAEKNPGVDVLVHAQTFSSEAHWLSPEPVPLAVFEWVDQTVEAGTEMGVSLSEVTQRFNGFSPKMNATQPVIVVISDGMPMDSREPDVETALAELLSSPYGKRAIRIAIAVGSDADEDLMRRIASAPNHFFKVKNAPEFAKVLPFATSEAVQHSSSPPSQVESGTGLVTAISIPSMPLEEESGSSELDPEGEVW